MFEKVSQFFASTWSNLLSNTSLLFRGTQDAPEVFSCRTIRHFLTHQTFLLCLINMGLEISIAIFEQEGDEIFTNAIIALVCGVVALALSIFEFIHKGRSEGAQWSKHGLLVYPASHGQQEHPYGSAVQAVGLFSAVLHVVLAGVDCVKRHYRWNWHMRFRIFPLAFVAVESATRFMHLRGHSGAVYISCNHGGQPREVLVRAVKYGDSLIVDCMHNIV